MQGVSTPNLVLGDLVADVAQNVMIIMISRPSRGQWFDSVRPYMGVVIWYKRHGRFAGANLPCRSQWPAQQPRQRPCHPSAHAWSPPMLTGSC